MRLIDNYFENLLLSDSIEFSTPVIEGADLKVKARNIAILPGHPLNGGDKEILLEEANLVFKGITKSIRMIYEYEDNPKVDKFRPPYKIVDVLFPTSKDEKCSFGLEGTLISPPAYIDWEIDCDSFTLEIT